MGIVNRSLDSSEQQYVVDYNIRETVTATSDYLHMFPQGGTIQSGKVAGIGLSGTPTLQLALRRFVVGAGDTLIPIGAALTVIAASTSGPMAYTFSTSAVQAGDSLVATHAGTNAALTQVMVSVVIQATQEIRSWSYS